MISVFAIGQGSAGDKSDADPGAWPVLVRTVEGEEITGRWLGFADPQHLEIEVEGETRPLPVDDLHKVSFQAGAKEVVADAAAGHPSLGQGVVVYLSDGGVLRGELASGGKDAVVLRSRGLGEVTMPFERLAAVQFAPAGDWPMAAEQFEALLTDRRPGEDLLITRSEAEVKQVPGRLESLEAAGGSFYFGDRSRPFVAEKMYGVVLAAGLTTPRKRAVLVTLKDGSRFAGDPLASSGSELRFEAGMGKPVVLPVSRIEGLEIFSGRMLSLVELEPANVVSEGRLHAPEPPAFNRAITGGGLMIDGRRFDRGLGMRSYTRVEYELGERFDRLLATIGMQDGTSKAGAVEFFVFGDDRPLFSSGLVTVDDGAKEIAVPLAGVGKLSLVVDYGDQIDLADHAVWGDPRLLRPRPNEKP